MTAAPLASATAHGLPRCCRDLACGKRFFPRYPDQVFCGGPCRTRHHNRRLARGLEASDALIAWGRRDPGAFGRLARLAKQWAAEDQALATTATGTAS